MKMVDKQIFINNKTHDVIDYEEYQRRRSMGSSFDHTAVLHEGIVYPIMSTDPKNKVPGVYKSGEPVSLFVKPTENVEMYSEDSIIDFGEAKSYRDVIEKKDALNRSQDIVLLEKNNILEPNVSIQDSVALQLMKNSLGAKAIDPESYRERLGSNYSNCMRLITSPNNHSITLKKMIAIAQAYDLNIDVTISDKSGCFNPMGKSFTARLTDEDLDEGDDTE